MADKFDALAARLGIPVARIPDWRKLAGAPGAIPLASGPAPVAPIPNASGPAPFVNAGPPSYEGMRLQDMGAQPAPSLIGPPPPPARSYEGATLSAPSAGGVSLAPDPMRVPQIARPGALAPVGGRPTVAIRGADNVSTASIGGRPLSPKAAAQAAQIADNSDRVARQRNIDGATFVDGPGDGPGAPTSPAVGGLVMVDKGGRRPASWQVHEGLNLGPDAERAVTSADEHGRAAGGLDYMAGVKAAEFERGYLERHEQAARAYASEEAARAEKFQTEYDKTMGHLDDLRAQIREAKVDPFGGMNAGLAKIGQAVAIGLGAFASKRGENMGLEAVKHSIETNIRKQEEDLNRLERGAKSDVNFLGLLKQQYGDVRQAKEAARIAYLEHAKSELAKSLGDPTVADSRLLAAYERLQGHLDDELVDRTARFKGLTQDRIIRHDVNAPARFAGVGDGFSHKDEADAKWLAEQREKAGIPQALANLEGVDQIIDTFGDGDIPGVGTFVGKVPDKLYGMFGSERGVAARQAVATVKNRARKAIAGSSLTEGEKAELDKELEAAGDANSLRRSVQSIRRSLHHQDANLRAGTRPGGEAYYEARGGQKRVTIDRPTTPTIREPK